MNDLVDMTRLGFLGERLQRNISLERYSGYGAGGPAEILVLPNNEAELKLCIDVAREQSVPVTLIAAGSNLLIRDQGIRGMVIKLGADFAEFRIEGTRVISGTAVMLPALARKTAVAGLMGLEFGVGVPGTVGGALYMNAGAAGQEIGVVTRRVKMMRAGEILMKEIKEGDFTYRSSCFQKEKNLILLEAEFELSLSDVQFLKQKQEELIRTRRATQPQKVRCAGCAFKNPKGDSAGRLIDQCGLKGLRIGDAQVSEVHANFLVNLGRASSSELEELMEVIEQRVQQETGIKLIREVCVLGDKA